MRNAPLLPYSYFAANPPELPARSADDPGLPSSVKTASVTSVEPQGVRLAGVTQDGASLDVVLEIVAAGVAHLLVQAEPDHRRVTLALASARVAVPVAIEQAGKRVRILSQGICVEVELDPFRVSFSGGQGTFLVQDTGTTVVTDTLGVLPCGFSTVGGQRVAFHEAFVCEPDEHFYGFGEKFTEFDKRGQRLEMWNYDAYGVHNERAYKNVPFYVSSRGYGVFVDSVRRVNFDMAHSNHAAVQIVAPDSALDYYVMAGPDLHDVIRRYADLVSHPILPPKWSLGTWMSSGFKDDSAEQVLARARELREHRIPCDVLHLDCYWQKYGRWSENLWDLDMFPDPEGLIQQVHALGFRVCLWINSYIGVESERFVEGKEKGYFLKTSAGETYVAQLWGNYHPPVAIVDFTNPEAAAWYREMLRVLLRQGVDVFKTDFGEGVPADAVAHNGMSGDELHNLYTLLYNDLVAEVTAAETGHTGLVWGRSTYAGGQRHAAQWGGDPNCTYQGLASTLRGGLSMAMVGHAFWSHDMGGFHRQPTPDLYVRWTQMGLFSPMSRWHGMTTRLPWEYGAEAERIVREAARLRYRLLPYIYTYAAISAEEGVPFIRPMVLEEPGDPLVFAMDLQYYFGREILVAPIYSAEGRRPVYLPGGEWIDFHTHEVISGPVVRWLRAPLDTAPLYVRANSLVPTMDPVDHIPDGPFSFVTFDGYLLANGAGSCSLRDEDGVTTVTATLGGSQLDVQLSGAKQKAGLRLFRLGDAPEITSVAVNGQPLLQGAHVDLVPESAPGWKSADGGVVAVVGA